MRSGVLILLAAAGVIGLSLYKGVKSFAENLRVQFDDVAIDSKSTKQALYLTLYYRLKLTFINPENVKADINSIVLDVYLGDQLVSTIRRNTLFTIPARDRVQGTFELNIPTVKLGMSAVSLISAIASGGSLPDVTVRGTLQTPFGKIDVNETLPFKL